jgi:hypothetical protein
MAYVLRWPDGAYNVGCGFVATLAEAARYPTIEAAEEARQEINTDAYVISVAEAQALEGNDNTISLDTLIDAIETATRSMTICVPSREFYRDRDAWTEETLNYVDPYLLLALLKGK